MKLVIPIFVFIAAACGTVFGDVEFSMQPMSTVVMQGTPIVFNIWFQSTNDVDIRGIDVHLAAGTGDGTGGLFSSATSTFFGPPVPPAIDWDLSEIGNAYFSRNLATEAPDSIHVTSHTMKKLGSVTLDTTGVAAGTYAMQFIVDGFSPFVLDANNLSVPFTTTDASYTISLTAVPEPASFVGAALLLHAGLVWRKRKQMAMK